MTNVYKNRWFVARNEKVRIPDFESLEPQEEMSSTEEVDDLTPLSENDSSFETESFEQKELEETVSDINNVEPVSEITYEEKPAAKILTEEDLRAIYEQSLKELASSVAQQAYYDALNKRKAELRECIASVQSLMNELRGAHRQFIEEYTNELKYMAIDIAEKMILEKIDEDDLVLERLVLQTIGSVKNAEWINVEISERLIGLVDLIKKDLEKPEYNGRAFVFPVAGSQSVCRVVSNEGTIVSTIEVQAKNLRKAFNEIEQQ